MHKPPPLFFSANRMGAPYGLLLGTILPDSSSSWTCFHNSYNSSDEKGCNLLWVGYTVGSTRGMENGALCSVIGNAGSANTRGYFCSNSASSSVEPSKRCSTSLPCAALCMIFKAPICSTVAKNTTWDLVNLTNLDAEANSHVRASFKHDNTFRQQMRLQLS